MDRGNSSTDLLDMAFVSPNLAKHDIQTGEDLGSDHLPIEISVDAPPHTNSFTTTPGTNSTRPTEKYLNQYLRQL